MLSFNVMNKRTFTLLLALLTFSITGFGQGYSFKVLANRGSNEFKSGDVWQPIKTGSVLQENDEVKLAQNAYLGLVSASGKALEVKDAGIKKVTDLLAQVKGGSSVVQKYTDFILSSNSPEAKKNRLSATGAVHRALPTPLNLVLPENQYSSIFNNTAIITWDGSKVEGPYVLTLRNMFDDVLDKFETSEKSYVVDFSKFQKENAIIVQVTSKADSREVSRQHLIKRLSPSEHENIEKSLDVIAPELSEPTALNKLILAGFYEENRLLIDAITAYEEAIRLAPDVPSYAEAYEEFLIRNNISK